MNSEKELQAAINQKCLECCCGSHNEVRDCKLKGCALYQYRPFQRARGGFEAAATARTGKALRGHQISVMEVLAMGG